ncbi:hypothetical protein CDD81_6313 [Ophiocordyceps australis]|uniref:Uncharacterized protein n=1 Tax=Ophiocordyceps australis TaxID=1399860 RepID=A0A2C5XHR1_9HYPO|nr:hypothetical protein CDD81_6313 [Ophiocordyceps australis]
MFSEALESARRITGHWVRRQRYSPPITMRTVENESMGSVSALSFRNSEMSSASYISWALGSHSSINLSETDLPPRTDLPSRTDLNNVEGGDDNDSRLDPDRPEDIPSENGDESDASPSLNPEVGSAIPMPGDDGQAPAPGSGGGVDVELDAYQDVPPSEDDDGSQSNGVVNGDASSESNDDGNGDASSESNDDANEEASSETEVDAAGQGGGSEAEANTEESQSSESNTDATEADAGSESETDGSDESSESESDRESPPQVPRPGVGAQYSNGGRGRVSRFIEHFDD